MDCLSNQYRDQKSEKRVYWWLWTDYQKWQMCSRFLKISWHQNRPSCYSALLKKAMGSHQSLFAIEIQNLQGFFGTHYLIPYEER